MNPRERFIHIVILAIVILGLLWIALDFIPRQFDRISTRLEAIRAQQEEAAIIQDIPERPRPSKKD